MTTETTLTTPDTTSATPTASAEPVVNFADLSPEMREKLRVEMEAFDKKNKPAVSFDPSLVALRMEPASVPPNNADQMMVKLGAPAVIRGVKLDEPEGLEIIQLIAGSHRVVRSSDEDIFSNIRLDVPAGTFVTVVVKNNSKEPRIVGGALMTEPGAQVAARPAGPPVKQPKPPKHGKAARGVALGAPDTSPGGEKMFKVDMRGWPLGGSNEVWVLFSRGELERLMQAAKGYPVTNAESPGLIRRIEQALGLR